MLFSNCKSGRIDHGMFKNSDFHDERQPESNMQPKPEIIIDIVEIRTETEKSEPFRQPLVTWNSRRNRKYFYHWNYHSQHWNSNDKSVVYVNRELEMCRQVIATATNNRK